MRELAELLTGLRIDREGETTFGRRDARPGPKTVLGVEYGPSGSLRAIEAALRGLAVHPATALHLASKLAVHIVADEPPEALVADLAATWAATGGDLGAVTEALLRH